MKAIHQLNRSSALKILLVGAMFAATSANAATYADYPVTLKGYTGDATTSVSYSGQVARHLLHNSLKKAIASGQGRDVLRRYIDGGDGMLAILDPVSSESFAVDYADVNAVSANKNLSGKTYGGLVAGWPGNMTGKEVLASMVDMAVDTSKGYDAAHGYDYAQLVSKFTMGAVFYSQACDNYLDEKLDAGVKPNDRPYKDGAAYTGKEHVWDEAFGYWGAAAHSASLTAKQNYDIAKKKDARAADINGDGVVNLKSEMNYGHAYYAAAFDKGGKTDYFNTITNAFIEGREIITAANGEKMSDRQHRDLRSSARVICGAWEMVIAEAVFKYAGSVHKDIEVLNGLTPGGDDHAKAVRTYAKHWGELKGFALSLATGGVNLGDIGVKIDRLIGFGPVMPDGTRVSGMTSAGAYEVAANQSMEDYMIDMLRLQKLIAGEFGIKAMNNDQLAGIANLSTILGGSESAEND